MDLASESPTDNNPQLPSSVCEGDNLGELSGDEMSQLQNRSIWTLEEIGYTYNSLRVYSDGHIEGGLHSPDYYAYSPHNNSWEDGLQTIESFDWVGTKDSEQDDLAGEEKYQDYHDVQASSAIDRMQVLDLPQAEGTKIDPQSTEQTSEPEPRDAPYIGTESPPWIPSALHEYMPALPTTSSEIETLRRPASPRSNSLPGTTTDEMQIDIATPTALPSVRTVGSEDVPTPTSRKENDTYFRKDQVNNEVSTAAIISSDENSEAEDGIESPDETEALGQSLVLHAAPQTTSRWHGLMLQQPPQHAISSEHLPALPLLESKRPHEDASTEASHGPHPSTNALYMHSDQHSSSTTQHPSPAHAREFVEHDQSFASEPTPRVTTVMSLKRSKPAKTEEPTDSEKDTPAKKKRRQTVSSELHAASANAPEVAGNGTVQGQTTCPRRTTSVSIQKPPADDSVVGDKTRRPEQQQAALRFAYFALGNYLRPLQEPSNTEMQSLHDDSIPIAPTTNDLADVNSAKPETPRDKTSVPARELSTLADTSPRDDARAQRAETREMYTIPSSQVLLHVNPKEQGSSTSVSETPLDFRNAESSILQGERDPSEAVLSVGAVTSPSASVVPKKQVSAVIVREIPGPPSKKRKIAPPKKATKSRKTPDVHTGKGEDTPELVSARSIEPKEPTNDISPPNNKTAQPKSTTNSSSTTSYDAKVLPPADQRHPLKLTYGKRQTRGDTKYAASHRSSNSISASDSSRAPNLIPRKRKAKEEEESDVNDDNEEDWFHDTIARANATTKAKAQQTKHTPTTTTGPPTLSLRTNMPGTSRAGTPALSVASTATTTLGANKYGFTPPRGKRTRVSADAVADAGTGAGAGTTATCIRKPKTKASVSAATKTKPKPKTKKSKVDDSRVPALPPTTTHSAADDDAANAIPAVAVVQMQKKGKKGGNGKSTTTTTDTTATAAAAAVDTSAPTQKNKETRKEMGTGPDRRTTRRACAVEEEIKKQEEKEGNVRLRLRSRDADGGRGGNGNRGGEGK